MKRALVSVTDKTGIVEFAKGLVELGFEIVDQNLKDMVQAQLDAGEAE